MFSCHLFVYWLLPPSSWNSHVVIKILINDKLAHTPPLFPLPLVPVYPAVFPSVSDSYPSFGASASPWPSSARSTDVERGCELSHGNIPTIGVLFRVCVASSGWFSYPCQILVIHVDLNVFLRAFVIKNQQFNRMCVPCVAAFQPMASARHYRDKVASQPACLVLFTYRGEWGKLY